MPFSFIYLCLYPIHLTYNAKCSCMTLLNGPCPAGSINNFSIRDTCSQSHIPSLYKINPQRLLCLGSFPTSPHSATGVKWPSLSYFASTSTVSIPPHYARALCQLTKKCIIQRYRLNALHIRIIHKIRINIKKHRHIHSLPSIQSLLLKAETLNLAEIWRHLSRTDTVGRHTNDVRIRIICCGVERQRSFAR